ncbi:MAG: hypothetical protein K0Q56_2523 [Sporolactobacillus laevolacticus]|nr:hypothetical protein [Sporolactobacillus laevolacticus]
MTKYLIDFKIYIAYHFALIQFTDGWKLHEKLG